MTSYEVSGKGKTVLLLHGWADSHKTFTGLQNLLSKDYRVISIDLPGFGGTNQPPAPWGLNDFSKFISDFLRKIGADQPYAYIGHSNGGAIAVHGLASGVLRCEKLILLASAGVRNRKKTRKLALKAIAKSGKAATIILPGSVRKRLRSKLYKAAGSDMLIAVNMQETFKRVVGQDIIADARRLKVPTLLIYGENDKITPPAYGEQLEREIAQARLRIIKDAGHYVHQDKTNEVVRLTKDFLS